MNAILNSLLAVSLLAISMKSPPVVMADSPAKVASPRFKARVTCFSGKLDSGSSCSAGNYQPDGTLHAKGKMTCGYRGRVSEIEWSFVERRDDKDVYRFTRRFPSDSPAAETTSKTVEFSEIRVVVFEDKHQVVVIEPPKK